MLIDEKEGRRRLLEAIARAGSAANYAKQTGATRAEISNMSKEPTHRDYRRITGKIARDLGFKPVYAYLLTADTNDPKQKQYENNRKEWLQQQDMYEERSTNMRVAGDQSREWGRRYPEKEG